MLLQDVTKRSPADFRSADQAVQEWELCLRESTTDGVYLHPALVLSGLPSYRGSLIYTSSLEENDKLGRISALAILRPQTFPATLMPRLLPPLQLRGYSLLANQIVGVNSKSSTLGFVRSFSQLLLNREAECLMFEEPEVGSWLWEAIESVAHENKRLTAFYYRSRQPRWWIRFPSTSDDYWKRFSSKARYNLRRTARSFDHKLLKYTSPDEVTEFLNKARQVSNKSWQSIRLNKQVNNSPDAQLYWSTIAKQRVFRSYILEHQGSPVAYAIGVQWNGCFTYEQIGYDTAHAQNSPGTVLLFRLLEDLIATDTPQVFDFGFGDAEYKKLFANHRTECGSIMLVSRASRPMLALRAEQMWWGLSRLVRSGIRRAGLESFFRRRVRKARNSAD